MPRLVIVSNRVPPPREWTQLAGGLAVRLKGAIAGRNTLWFGWSGTIADQSSAEPTVTKVGKVTFATLDLAETHYMSGEARTTSQPRQSPKAAKSPKLKDAFETHGEESSHQVERLTEVFEIIGKPVRAKTCEAMQGLTSEMEEDLEEFGATEAADAVLIGCAQAIEHYEIARYGVLQGWARKLGLSEVETLLGETLQEEKRADQLLSQIADQADADDTKRASRDDVTSPAKVPSRSKSAPDSASRDTTRA